PPLTRAACLLVQVSRKPVERGLVLACCVDLEQLDLCVLALGILGERFLEYFLRLRVPTVGDIDLGFGQRVDIGRGVRSRDRCSSSSGGSSGGWGSGRGDSRVSV